MVERNHIKKSQNEHELQIAEYTIQLKQRILEIPIKDQKIFDDISKNSKNDLFKSILNADNGLLVQSKIVQLYLKFRDNQRFYDIPWLFYDTLCSLKNFINLKKSTKLSRILYRSQPYTIPIDLVKAFSTTKIINLIESD